MEFEVKDQRMMSYLREVEIMKCQFKKIEISHITQGGNSHANSLATLASTVVDPLLRIVSIELLPFSSLTPHSNVVVLSIHSSISWIDPIVASLQNGSLPKDKKEFDRIRCRSPRYQVSEDGKLYKRSYSGPYLLCVHPEAIEVLLEELHEGIQGSHTGGQSLAHQAHTQGYWWPNIRRHALEFSKKYDKCQRFASSIHQPGGLLNSISSLWPFAQWGLDIVGPFPKATGNRKWLLVGTDYFTKWMEVEPLADIRDTYVKRFVWNNIVTRFGVPKFLISNNGLQFDSKAFQRYCLELGITNRYSTPSYRQGNGQAEATNKSIVNGLKR